MIFHGGIALHGVSPGGASASIFDLTLHNFLDRLGGLVLELFAGNLASFELD